MSRFDVHLERWNAEALDAGETYERESDEGLTLVEAVATLLQLDRVWSDCAEVYAHDYGVSLEYGDLRTGGRVSASLCWPRNTTRASKKRIFRAVINLVV